MAEYIDREAVKLLLYLLSARYWNPSTGEERPVAKSINVNELLDIIPAEDVEPVLHGHWIPVDETEDAFDCSECDAMVGRRCNFCPKCGAKMDVDTSHD